MKSQQNDIIQELKSLKAPFLLNNKERAPENMDSMELSEGFYQNILSKTPSNEPKTISISPNRKTSILKIAASLLLLVSISALTYTFLAPKNIETSPLEQLVSQTTSQEIYDYLDENGMPADEEFLIQYVNTNIEVSNKN